MRLIEEQILHKNYLIFKRNKKKDINEVFSSIDSFKFLCVQNLAIKRDIKFFDEISFILSVISSICAKPLINNKIEEVLLRSDQVPSIQYEGFKHTLQDSSLWKKKNMEMLPESIYFNQSSDEIATYENLFVVNLIDLLSIEMDKYNSFYLSLIKTYDGNNNLNIDSKLLSNSFDIISLLERKLKFIKNTNFYKQVKRKHITLTKITPTNILLKNRLYNYCFKFYRKYIRNEDNVNVLSELKYYYLLLILKSLKNHNYKSTSKNKTLNDKILSFRNNDFNLNLEINDNNINFIMVNRHNKDKINHNLIIDIDNDFSSIKIDNNAITNTAINLFKIASLSLENDVLIKDIYNININNEEELINYYIDNINIVIKSNSNLYSKLCPICKGKHLTYNDNNYICDDCKSIYNFYKYRTNEYMHIKKLRRN